ncbi:YggS family pyridoxal phosphate-dependent enzyme [bacterium]|nr:YggS family pyridoxal phosphate-dependent enzyme [bacterium]
MVSTVAERLEQVRGIVADAAAKSGRQEQDIRLVAVTKFHPASVVLEAVQAGLTEFGENRFQEVPEKQADVRQAIGDQADRLTWHFIGQLQSNKARKVIHSFSMVQSVDRESLVQRLDRIAGEEGRSLDVLMQVKVTGAEQQGGVEPDDAQKLAELISVCENLSLHGLMAIGPVTGDRSVLHSAFSKVRTLAETIDSLHLPGVSMNTLSMGMSGDFDVAIEEGATLIRIGTVLFGSRS